MQLKILKFALWERLFPSKYPQCSRWNYFSGCFPHPAKWTSRVGKDVWGSQNQHLLLTVIKAASSLSHLPKISLVSVFWAAPRALTLELKTICLQCRITSRWCFFVPLGGIIFQLLSYLHEAVSVLALCFVLGLFAQCLSTFSAASACSGGLLNCNSSCPQTYLSSV